MMKRSGYLTMLHIYLIFLLALTGAVLAAAWLGISVITVQRPDGAPVRSDWPEVCTKEFAEQIYFAEGGPQIRQQGIRWLQDNGVGLQLLDPSGQEIGSMQKPRTSSGSYTLSELLRMQDQSGSFRNSGTTAFTGTVSDGGREWIYILYFPLDVAKVTMYLNGDRFAGGRAVFFPALCILLLAIAASGLIYGIWTARAMKRLTASIREISLRGYHPVKGRGLLQDLYDSLNGLDAEIRAGDRLRQQTEKMQKEWIAIITHDLKTPLSPIRGYAEILQEEGGRDHERCRRYAGIMLKNVSYIETLADDLKLTYQLEMDMLPIRREEQNMIRFLKELVIDILNTPEYENRILRFESDEDAVPYSFDQSLMTRALRNLIINAFVHGEDDAEVTLTVSGSPDGLCVEVADDGRGMSAEETEHVFERYYRGTHTGESAEGT